MVAQILSMVLIVICNVSMKAHFFINQLYKNILYNSLKYKIVYTIITHNWNTARQNML